MRTLFTLIIGGSMLLASSASAQNQQAVNTKTKVEAKEATINEFKASDKTVKPSEFTKENLRLRQVQEQRTSDHKAQIEQLDTEIEQVERHLNANSANPDYKPEASKARLKQLKATKAELNNQTK